MISAVIPVFNEEKTISDCLKSLSKQTFKDLEIILIDDGSTDRTIEVISNIKLQMSNVKLFRQKHLGPGIARNLGAKKTKGNILVFVDGDMTFDRRFIDKLTRQIRDGKAIGTFSKEEIVANKENIWSQCWNFNKGLPFDRMHPQNYPNRQNVFRAILKKEFLKSGGFTPIGYIDDHTIAEKLGVQAVAAPGAIFYHRNPDNLEEIFRQARWIGKSEYKRRKIKNEDLMRIISIIRYNPIFSIINGFMGAIELKTTSYIVFKVVYDLAVEISLFGSFFDEQVNK